MNITGLRKFSLTVSILIGSFVLACLDKLDGGAWVTIATLALGIYGASNVTDKKLGGAG